MIGNAVVTILKASSDITALTAGRITLSIIPQKQAVPCIYVGTDSVKPVPVRDPMGSFWGTLEVGFQTDNYADLDTLTKAVRGALDNYAGTNGDTTLNINRGETTPDDYDENLRYHTRALSFQVSGSIAQ